MTTDEMGENRARAGSTGKEQQPWRRGVKDVSWRDPGDWQQGEKLRYVMERIGLDPEGGTGVLVVEYEPGCKVDVHYHDCDYCSIVVEGSIEISHVIHKVGEMRFVKAGTVYGPLIAGPEGCTVIDIFAVGHDPMSARNTYFDLESRRKKNLESREDYKG